MQEISFSYGFEISKLSLQNCLREIENSSSNLGEASKYYIKMGLASLTLLENAFKGVDFNFNQNTLQFLNKLFSQIKQSSQKDYNVYCELLGSYFGWCAVKKYNAYFATYENTFCLIVNNKVYSPKHIIEFAIENNKDITQLFNDLK